MTHLTSVSASVAKPESEGAASFILSRRRHAMRFCFEPKPHQHVAAPQHHGLRDYLMILSNYADAEPPDHKSFFFWGGGAIN
jgi:hypothetical protein